MEQRELDGIRLLRQVPAITELSLLDDQGREQLRISRQAWTGSAATSTSPPKTPKTGGRQQGLYGLVNFRRGSEPFMTLSVAGARREAGVSVAEVNLTHIWDVVNQIHVGRSGRALGGRPRPADRPPRHQPALRNTDSRGWRRSVPRARRPALPEQACRAR
jgi:hypothetical protein